MKMKRIIATMLTAACLLGNGRAVFAQMEEKIYRTSTTGYWHC